MDLAQFFLGWLESTLFSGSARRKQRLLVRNYISKPVIFKPYLLCLAEKESEKGDSIEAPLCPYNLQPGIKGRILVVLHSRLKSVLNPGNFLWLTGAPGAGKSTSAQKLARDKGIYIYIYAND